MYGKGRGLVWVLECWALSFVLFGFQLRGTCHHQDQAVVKKQSQVIHSTTDLFQMSKYNQKLAKGEPCRMQLLHTDTILSIFNLTDAQSLQSLSLTSPSSSSDCHQLRVCSKHPSSWPVVENRRMLQVFSLEEMPPFAPRSPFSIS